MNELIKIQTNENNDICVAGRELHEKLGVKTEYKKWFTRMCEYGFIENQDYARVTQKCTTLGGEQNITNHIIKLDMAKEICMIQRTEIGKKFRQYFIECEKALREQTQFKLPTTYRDAVAQLLEQIDKNIEQEKLLKEENTKRIEAEQNRDRLIHQSKLYTTSEIAKELGLKSAIALNKMLAEDKVQYKCNNTWLLYSKYADRGLVSIKQDVLDNGRIVYDRRWTGAGRDLILSMYSNK